MSADSEIKKVLQEFGEDFNDKGTVWRVQGTAVISHKALERIAAKAGIKYASPTIIRAERDEAVLLVSGTLGDRMEWSIGEALVNVNYRVSGKQAGYVWAMAEKRAKDRVILKLVSLHGLAYSEEEADEFRERPQEAQRQTPVIVPSGAGPSDADKAKASGWIAEVQACESRSDLTALFRTPEWTAAKADMTPEAQKLVQDALARHPQYQQRAA